MKERRRPIKFRTPLPERIFEAMMANSREFIFGRRSWSQWNRHQLRLWKLAESHHMADRVCDVWRQDNPGQVERTRAELLERGNWAGRRAS